jgi:hypothetical protein
MPAAKGVVVFCGDGTGLHAGYLDVVVCGRNGTLAA